MLVKIKFKGGYLVCKEKEIEQSKTRLEKAGHVIENVTKCVKLQMFVGDL